LRHLGVRVSELCTKINTTHAFLGKLSTNNLYKESALELLREVLKERELNFDNYEMKLYSQIVYIEFWLFCFTHCMK